MYFFEDVISLKMK